MLTDLTPEQDRILDVVSEEYIHSLADPNPYDDTAVRAWLAIAYAACDLSCPSRVEVVDSPFAACELASKLTGKTVDRPDYVGLSDGGWVARYDVYNRLGVLSDAEATEVLALRAFLRCAWDHILLDECAIVVRRPSVLVVDDDGNLHSTDGPAIRWANGEQDWAHRGVWITEKIAIFPRTHTREEYLDITDTEVRRALCERAGWDWIADLLGATVVNRWTDPDTALSYELLRYDGSALLRKQSPRLQNGDQPWYCEPVHEDLTTAQAARKWQATSFTPAECEATPVMRYGVET